MLRHFLFAHRDCELSIFGGIQNSAGHSSVQSALVNTVLSERIGLDNLPMSLPISVTLIVQEITKPSAWWSFIPACPPRVPRAMLIPINRELGQGKFTLVQETVYLPTFNQALTHNKAPEHLSCFVLFSPSKIQGNEILFQFWQQRTKV